MKIKILDERAKPPAYATPGSAAMDLVAIVKPRPLYDEPEGITIQPGETCKVGTGLAIHIDSPTIAALILPRSGLATNQGITVANAPGLIDSDYQGELMVALYNRSNRAYTVKHGDRIAQLTFIRIQQIGGWSIVENFDTPTVRGVGGFGSTGK